MRVRCAGAVVLIACSCAAPVIPSVISDGGTAGGGTAGGGTAGGGTAGGGTAGGGTAGGGTAGGGTAGGGTAGGCGGVQCLCEPGAESPCYDGPAATRDAGACHAGHQTCAANGLAYGPCLDQQLPQVEDCTQADLDCDGIPANVPDVDGDGFNRCAGDCCETTAQCASPQLVNPAAYDFPGNGVDDDCDSQIDDAGTCDTGLASDSADAGDYARALDLCRFVRGAVLTIGPDGGLPAAAAHSIRASFGPNNTPHGSAFTVLSTGVAAAPGHTNPTFGGATLSTDFGLAAPLPADWISANFGRIPAPTHCIPIDGCSGGTCIGHDPVMLDLALRAPSNARGFTVKIAFFTTDYAERVCSSVVDGFIALKDSQFVEQGPLFGDKNLAGPVVGTVGANLTANLTAYFTQCVNGTTGCVGGLADVFNLCTGTGGLVGTGYDVAAPGTCDPGQLLGGGTGWLNISGNIVPGEDFRLRFLIWDSGDGNADSTVLLDAFQWSASNVTPGLSL